MINRNRGMPLIALLVFFSFIAGSKDLKSQEKKPTVVKLASFVSTAYFWPTFIADAKGFLAEENLKLEWTELRSTPDILRYLSTGAVDFTIAVPNMTITGIEKGADVVVVGGYMDQVTANLMAKSDIRSVKELKGKVVAGSGLNDITAIGLRRTFRANGISDNEWNLIVVGGTRDRFAALTSGAIDAAPLSQPFDMRAAEMGYNNVAPQSQYLKGFPWLIVSAYRPWAESHPEVVAKFLRAHMRAIDWLYDPSNRNEAISSLLVRVKTPQDVAENLYKMYVTDLHVFGKDLAIPKEGVQVTLDILAETGDIKPPLKPAEKYISERYYELAKDG